MSALDEARKEKVMNAMEHTKAFIAAVAEFDADQVRAAAEVRARPRPIVPDATTLADVSPRVAAPRLVSASTPPLTPPHPRSCSKRGPVGASPASATPTAEPRFTWCAPRDPTTAAAAPRVTPRKATSLTAPTPSPLTEQQAAQRGDPSIVRVLVKDAGVPVDARDKDGATPLMAAADYGKPDAVKCLLALGADASAKSNNGTAAMHRAAGSAMGGGPKDDKASQDCVKCVKYLLEAQEGGVDDTAALESRADDGATPFLMACSRGAEAAVEFLAARGANAAATLKSGVGAASLAAASGNPGALGAALRHGAPTGARPVGGMTALHIAASHPNTSERSLELVERLLDAKADPNVADSEGLKAVHAAAAVGRAAVVDALVPVTEPDAEVEEWNAFAVQKTVQAKLAAMGAGGGDSAAGAAASPEGAALAAAQVSETCVPHDVPTEVRDAETAAKTKREGDEAFIAGDNAVAVDKYTKSLDADGTNEKVWANRAAAKLKLRDYVGALRDARTAKKIDCEYVKAWFREGTALTELGDYEGAALCFFEGMQVEGQSENPDLKRGFDAAIKKGREAMGKK